MVLVEWVLVAGVISLVSRYLGGSGSFRRPLASVGCGQVPLVLPATVATGTLVVTLSGAPEFATGAAAESWLRSSLQEDPVRTVLSQVV